MSTRHALSLNVATGAEATPVLNALSGMLTNRTDLHDYLATDAEAMTRDWIREAAKSRHTTAEALGASPTNYLSQVADLVAGYGDESQATVDIFGAIFRRVEGPVTVRPKRAKYLTIPVDAESYGQRARDFSDLKFKVDKDGRKFLARVDGTEIKPLFALVKKATLPQDAGLLPSLAHYEHTAESTARAYVMKRARDFGITL